MSERSLRSSGTSSQGGTSSRVPDRDAVAIQIGRAPRSIIDVRARCHLGLPVVIAVPPHLDDGTPFPTRYWLTCPLATRRVSRAESLGGVKAAEKLLATDRELRARHDAATARYAAERDNLIADASGLPRPTGGVGGTERGVKCLHAHYADHAAGNDNPVGELAASDVEPLDCSEPCVSLVEGRAIANPRWSEPRR